MHRSTRIRGIARAAAGAALWFGAAAAHSGICLSGELPHGCASVESCLAAIENDPLDAAARLKLCDLRVDAGEIVEAALPLRRGLQLCSDRRGTCGLLERALSNVEERRRTDERDDGEEATRRERELRRGFCLGPVATDGVVDACEEIIADEPDEELYAALIEKLLRRQEPARALRALQEATETGIASPELQGLEGEALEQRSLAARECLEEDRLQACDAALLTGARDEAALHRKRASLLAESGRGLEAFRALRAAFDRSRDGETARAIVALEARMATPAEELDFLRLKARAFRFLGREEAERSTLQALILRDPQAAEARARLAQLQPSAASEDEGVEGAAAEAGSRPVEASFAERDTTSPNSDETDSRASRVPQNFDEPPRQRGTASSPVVARVEAARSNRILPDGRTH